MRAALYHRVSTVDQNATNARDELQGYAKRIGAEVVLDIEETGSGARNSRPGLQKVMTAARKGKVDVVIVWALDRFGRSTLDLLANINTLTDSGIRFVAVTQSLDVKPNGDAMSKLILTVLAAVAEFERSIIIERTRSGMARAKREGIHCGRPRVEVDADAVRELKGRGASWSEVSEQLGISVGAARRSLE